MDVEIIFRIAAIGILVTVVNLLLKKADKDEFAALVSLAGIVIVLIMVMSLISSLFDSLRSILRLY